MIKKIALCLATFALAFGTVACEGDQTVSETYPLHEVMLGSQTDTNGSFFLIGGGVGSHKNEYYYYYVESPDGTVNLHKNKYDDVVLRLVPDGTKPFVKCTGKQMYVEPGNRFDYHAWMVKDYCVFNVPESSIGSAVDIDVKNLK